MKNREGRGMNEVRFSVDCNPINNKDQYKGFL